MTREEIIEILGEDAQEFDDQATMIDGPFPGLAALRRKHAAALREAIELLRKEQK